MKKLISTFLCLALTTSMISTAALAAEPTIQDTISKNQEYVINESSPLKSQPTTIAEIDEMFRVLDNAILTNDSKKEAEISNSLEAAGVREVTLAEILAKTGVENAPVPVSSSDIVFNEVHSEITVQGKDLEIMRIYARPQYGSRMFHQGSINTDAEPDMRAGTLNMLTTTATFAGGLIPKAGVAVSALSALKSIFDGFTANTVIETIGADYSYECIENTVFLYFFNENNNLWTHIGTCSYLGTRLVPQHLNIETKDEIFVDIPSDTPITPITDEIYDDNYNNAYDCYQYWTYYGPSSEHQATDWNVELLEEEEVTIPMECPDLPGACS